MYIGAGKGATAYEIQIGRLYVRFLRPRYMFWPYRSCPACRVTWPRFVRVFWLSKGGSFKS